MADPHSGGLAGRCLNCGAAVTSAFCPDCGQSAHVHRTVASIIHDLLHGVFHFEGRIWRTIPMLALHPGELTRRYIAGERARFVSPLALFLFTVFLLFAVYSSLVAQDVTRGIADGWRSVPSAAPQQHDGQDRAVASGRDAGSTRLSTRWPWLARTIEHAGENPSLTVYKVQSATYKFSWVLIFLSTPFVALAFANRRRFGLYDHATFVTYSLSFMSLLIIVVQLLTVVSAPGILLLAMMFGIPPVHIFKQLRGAYEISVLAALWRTIFLMLVSVLLLAIFILGIAAIETNG